MSIKLRRSIGLTGLVFYGVGTMVGGGIYALLGKVVGEGGSFAPWSMLLAGVMAIFSALTFAELSSRFPFSGGPAKYITEAFNNKILGSLFGWLVIATGVVSAATLTVAMSGFFLELLNLPAAIGKPIVVVTLLILACWGIKQSVTAVAIVTLIEVAGLMLVIGINSDSISISNFDVSVYVPSAEPIIWSGIIAGSFIAFYAFIGFEDMVALAEEVKASEKNLPKAIVISLVITLLLYLAISFIAVMSTDLPAFVSSNTPMAHLVKSSTWLSPQVLVMISLLAGFNGALVQVIMASRILYGMANEKQAPRIFSRLSEKSQTPLIASFMIAVILLMLAMFIELLVLAKLTSGIILFVFAGMNVSLIKLKLGQVEHHGFNVPFFVPVVGFVVSVGSLLFALLASNGGGH